MWSLDSRSHPYPTPIWGRRRVELGDEFLATLAQKDTKDQGDEGDDSQHTSKVGHSHVQGGGGPMVEENTVQAHKEQSSREGQTSSDVV